MKNRLNRLKKILVDLKIITATLVVLIKASFLGVLIAEILFFVLTLADQINRWIFVNNYEYQSLIICIVYLVFLISYLFIRDFFTDIRKIIDSRRFDILFIFYFGAWISVVWGGFFLNWDFKIIYSLNIEKLFVLISGPFLLGALVIFRSLSGEREKIDSSFVIDLELEERENDLLNFTEKANRFAERVFNGGSSDSFVFGVDAPWGIGKSTFLNFCKEYWKENYLEETLIYKFTPLKHSGTTNLLDIFIDGLITTIQKDSYIPEIRPLISRYSRLLKEVQRFSIFGFTIPILTVEYTVDEAWDDLSAVLVRFPKKVIIIVDDLDRISFSELKDILFVIRKSFVLPNLSYVICYDTENIGILDAESPNSEKISEFLEKFVNIKISLYLDREDLSNYVSENLEKALATKLVDPLPIRQAIGGLLDIYKSPNYHEYLPFIGDVRKLKRLINTVVMFELETTDFKNSDFDKRDLIHLLIIYIYYPVVFRKIYNTETKEGRGFFSLVIWIDDGYPEPKTSHNSPYRNSIYYSDYIKELKENGRDRECFLLEQVFDVKRLEDPHVDSVPEEIRTSLACFNGGWTNGRNLEAYLNLIVKLSKPQDTGQYKFYANWKDKIFDATTTIKDAFENEKFVHEQSEQPREKLLRLISNNARTLKKDVGADIINYLLDYISDYSLIEFQEIGIGFRHDIDYLLIRILNDAGWTDRKGGHSNNTEENIQEIAEWIFGEKTHLGNGVIDKLSNPDRGILGFHDLMLFRLFCSADRGGDIFDLTRSLAFHANKKAPTVGDTRDIAREEMREISQKVFAIFKSQYIDQNKNIFNEISLITTEQLAGKYSSYLQDKIQLDFIKQIDVDKKVVELKTRIGSFILYQLGNSEIRQGVGCGYYDPSGTEDKHTIRDIINDYIFTTCFDMTKSENAIYFIDYLFRNFANVFGSAGEDGPKYLPTINEFTKVLDKNKLAIYWKKNSEVIKAMELEKMDKSVPVGNDEVTYKEYIPLVYEVLDENVKNKRIIDQARTDLIKVIKEVSHLKKSTV